MKKSIIILLVVVFSLFSMQSISFAEEIPPEVIEEAVLEEIPAEDIPIVEEAAEPAEAMGESPAVEAPPTGESRTDQFKRMFSEEADAQKFILPAPSFLYIFPGNATSLRLSWGSVYGSYGYSIFCWIDRKENGWWVADLPAGTTRYVHYGLTPGVRYYYMVAPIEYDNTLGWSAGPESNVTRDRILPPANQKAVSNGYNSIKATWTADYSAYGYVIFFGTDVSDMRAVKETSDNRYNSITSTGLQTGTKYYYEIYSIDRYGDMSMPPETISATPQVAKPASIKATPQSGRKVALSWSKPPGASGYYIYRATSKTGSYSLIKTVGASTSSFTNTGLTAGKTYYYKIVPYRTVDGSKLKGATSAIVSAKAKT